MEQQQEIKNESRKRFLLRPDAIIGHVLCPGLIVVLICDLISGQSRYSTKELLLALVFIITGYVLLLFFVWAQSRQEQKEKQEAILNPKSPNEVFRNRRNWRRFSLIWLNVAGMICVILGHRGFEIDLLPAHYLGYGLLILGLAGFFGVNIWYKGPIDPRNDPQKDTDRNLF